MAAQDELLIDDSYLSSVHIFNLTVDFFRFLKKCLCFDAMKCICFDRRKLIIDAWDCQVVRASWLIFKIGRMVKRKILDVYFYFVFLNPGFTPHSTLLLLLLFLFVFFFCFIKFPNIVTFVYDFQ